jgi:hypothetical protein
MSAVFLSNAPTSEDYWRSIILFGRNVASYKFALATALLELKPQAGQLIKLEELAKPFSSHIVSHLKQAKQGQFAKSRFLDACKSYGKGTLSLDRLIDQTVRFGFVNVIDAFHVVVNDPIPNRFFLDERQTNTGIRITDEFAKLSEGGQILDLPSEVDARWRLVETAWDLGLSRNIVNVAHDAASDWLFTFDTARRRRNVTSSRGALNGYQKGQCFYCFRPIHLAVADQFPDVDHFFPHLLKQAAFGNIIDGVWNLVLACRECNRGTGGKWGRLPSETLLERLYRRNEYLIQSHHPLRETLRAQTGMEEPQRRAFLSDIHQKAFNNILHRWEPEMVVQGNF